MGSGPFVFRDAAPEFYGMLSFCKLRICEVIQCQEHWRAGRRVRALETDGLCRHRDGRPQSLGRLRTLALASGGQTWNGTCQIEAVDHLKVADTAVLT